MENNINETTAVLVKNITDNFLFTLNKDVQKLVVSGVAEKLAQLDIGTLVREHVNNILNTNNKTFKFPDRSVPGSSINPAGLYLRADQISGGTHANFESTGIQDQATMCQVTIMDAATVFENQLTAKTLLIAGDAEIQGDLNLTGTLSKDSQLFRDVLKHSVDAITGELQNGILSVFRDQVFARIASEGIDAANIVVERSRLVQNNTLAPSILNSNLQKVGALKELQVIGETLLDETVYVSSNRMGINTIDPEAVVDIWDQEVQITIGKFAQNVAVISAPKSQRLVLGSNRKTNLVINPDGSVSVDSLNIGKINHTTMDHAPGEDAVRGSVVWNSEPEIGSPIGWVSLGGARWAKFGIITA